MLEWVAVCRIDEASFLNYCLENGLEPEETTNVLESVKLRSTMGSVEWIAGLPEFTAPLQFSRRFDESPFNGLFALYDRGTGTMILHLHNG